MNPRAWLKRWWRLILTELALVAFAIMAYRLGIVQLASALTLLVLAGLMSIKLLRSTDRARRRVQLSVVFLYLAIGLPLLIWPRLISGRDALAVFFVLSAVGFALPPLSFWTQSIHWRSSRPGEESPR